MQYANDWDDELVNSAEYQMAYDTIRHAMKLVTDYHGESNLTRLANVLYKASFFVNDELDELPEEAEELGLHVWQQEERERKQEKEGIDHD